MRRLSMISISFGSAWNILKWAPNTKMLAPFGSALIGTVKLPYTRLQTSLLANTSTRMWALGAGMPGMLSWKMDCRFRFIFRFRFDIYIQILILDLYSHSRLTCKKMYMVVSGIGAPHRASISRLKIAPQCSNGYLIVSKLCLSVLWGNKSKFHIILLTIPLSRSIVLGSFFVQLQ